MSFADSMQDLELTNLNADMPVVRARPNFLERVVNICSRVLRVRSTSPRTAT